MWVQLVFFAWIAVLAVGKGLAEAGVDIPFLPEVSLHAVCPFGGVVTLYNLATLGRYVQKIH
ncbi:MAG: 4Fe-4S binding protein, partial [Clostridiaceae bacterium]|nr:4Fe-4S binding protein [Clostridiaceae bacterium]